MSNDNRSIFDQFSGVLDGIGSTINKGLGTASNVLNNYAAFELAKNQQNTAKYIDYLDKYQQPSQYNDVPYTPWTNPANEGLKIDNNILMFAAAGIGIFAIVKLAK